MSAYNFTYIDCPLITYQDLNFEQSIISQYPDIIISSKYLAKKLPFANTKKNIWVVGEESAKILKDKNYLIKYIANNFAQLLKALPKTSYPNMMYLSGDQITKETPKEIRRLIIYQVKYTSFLTEAQVQSIKNGIDYVLLYSYNSAKTFLKIVKTYDLLKFLENSIIIAISLKVAEILKPYFAHIIHCKEGEHQQIKGLLLNDQSYLRRKR